MMPTLTILQETGMASLPTPVRARKHHGAMKWSTRWHDDAGIHRTKRFGLCDEMTHGQARAAFKAWLNGWHDNDAIKNPRATIHTYTTKELAIDYLAHAKVTFLKNGRQTSHIWNVAYAMQALMDTFGLRVASTLTNPDIAALRDAMIWHVDDEGKKTARAMSTVNDRLYIIKTAFGWAREKGLVSAETMLDVLQVKPLRKGRSEAIDPQKVDPVNEHWVVSAKDHLPSPVKAMIDLQWLTGMRPGEACSMRPCDIDMTDEIWLYTPLEHKTEHLEMSRVIPLGPQCQTIIKPFLARQTDANLFSPREAQAERLEDKRNNRKTKLWPSHASRPLTGPSSSISHSYNTASYRRAIFYACEAAKIETWTPNQLRHSAATRLNKGFGIEEVAVMLGHADIRTTRIYADPDLQKAIEIARKAG